MRVYKSNVYIIIPLTPTLSREERGLLRQPPSGEGWCEGLINRNLMSEHYKHTDDLIVQFPLF